MGLSWRRVTVAAVATVYVAGAGSLAALTVDRIRTDRARRAQVDAQEQRRREARAHAIRMELELEREHAARSVPAPR